MSRIAVLYSGISFQYETLNEPELRGLFSPVSIYDLPQTDLRRYDAVIVPRSVDQVALNDYRRIIREYLDFPGIVVALGDYRGSWIPGCIPGGFTPEDDDPLIKVADHPILDGLESPDLHWHRGINGLCSHGHLVPPEGVEVLIRNSRGDVILYEDRVTTAGIIVAGTQFDLFCHCFSGDEGALRALNNLVSWIDAHAEEIRAGRRRTKIGVVYSGLHFHHDLFSKPEYTDMELLYIRTLSSTDLLSYNVLIVPRESNQELLYAARDQIAQFLEHGGSLLSFGEVVRPWLPGLVWTRDPLRVCYPDRADETYARGTVITDSLRIEDPGHLLFGEITLDDLKWHYHGVFVPMPGQRVLVSNGQGRAVVLLDEASYPGTVLAMTLDPEEHAGFGEVTITEPFLARCMQWARAESERIENRVGVSGVAGAATEGRS
jgi:hypothetical protein